MKNIILVILVVIFTGSLIGAINTPYTERVETIKQIQDNSNLFFDQLFLVLSGVTIILILTNKNK